MCRLRVCKTGLSSLICFARSNRSLPWGILSKSWVKPLNPGGSWVWASLYLLLKRSHHVLKGCPFIEDLKMGAAYLCLKFAATGFIFLFSPSILWVYWLQHESWYNNKNLMFVRLTSYWFWWLMTHKLEEYVFPLHFFFSWVKLDFLKPHH